MSGSSWVARTLEQAIGDLAEHHPANGYTFEDDLGQQTRLPYGDLVAEGRRLGGVLQARGLARGDRLVLVLPRSEPFVTAFTAAVLSGIVAVPVSHPMGFGGTEPYLRLLSGQLQACGARAVLAERRLLPMLAPLVERHPGLDLFCHEDLDGDAALTPARATLDDLCIVQFTSGSTGTRRGVEIRHGNVAANVHSVAWAMTERHLEPGVTPTASWLPLFHDLGLVGAVLCPFYLGNPVHMLTALSFLKKPVRWLQAISEVRAGVALAPNFAYEQCARRVKPAQLEGLDLGCWKLAGCGAEPIRPDALRRFARLLAPAGFDARALAPAYGMAEATLAIAFDGPMRGLEVDRVDPEALQTEGRAVPAADDAPGIEIPSCGRPLLAMEVSVFEPASGAGAEPLPERRVGELRIRGPSVTRGYWGAPDHDPEVFTDGWLRTGDEGYVAEGRVFVSGRLKDTLIVRGRSYRPQDVEWAAAGVDGVLDRRVAAVAVQDPDQGERAVLLVESLATARASQGRIARAVKRRVFEALGLAGVEVVLVRKGSLPTTSSGKLQRSRARELYVGGLLG